MLSGFSAAGWGVGDHRNREPAYAPGARCSKAQNTEENWLRRVKMTPPPKKSTRMNKTCPAKRRSRRTTPCPNFTRKWIPPTGQLPYLEMQARFAGANTILFL